MKLAKAALVATLLIGEGTLLLRGMPADGQALDSLRQKQKGERQRPARIDGLNAQESAAIFPLYQAAQAQDWAAARTALPQARAGAASPAGRYLVGQLMYQLANATQDRALGTEAVAQMVQSGGANPEQLAALQRVQANEAYDAALASGNFAALEMQAQQRLDASPNDPTLLEQLAIVKGRLNKNDEAFALIGRAVAARQAAGQTISPDLRRRLAGLAYQARSPETLRYMREWLAAEPGTNSWHDTLAIYAEQTGAPKLDIYRLMRAAGAMTIDRDYAQYIEVALEARAYSEAKAVIEEGFQRNLLTTNAGYARDRQTTVTRLADDRASLPGERTAALAGNDVALIVRLGDTYYGYGEYTPAAELYRAALQKGGQDANRLNVRLGAALARGGDRPGAEAALRAVSSGPYAELAQLWLVWLSLPRG